MKNKKRIVILAIGIMSVTGIIFYQMNKFDYIGEYNEFGLAIAEKDGKFGFVNEKKDEIIPVIYDQVNNFTSFGVTVVSKDGKKGCYNIEGAEIYPVTYEDIQFEEIFNQDYAKVMVDEELNFISEKGTLLYDKCEPILFENWIKICSNEKYGCVNEDGEEILPCIFSDLEIQYSFMNILKVKLDDSYNFLDIDGNLMFDEVEEEDESGWMKARKDELYGYIDTDGYVVIPLEYHYIDCEAFGENGYAKIVLDNTENFIDVYGNLKYKEIRDFAPNGLAAAKNDNDFWGFIDENGNEVISFDYEEVEDFDEFGMAKIKKWGKYGYINELGVITIQPMYEEIDSFSEKGIARISEGKRYNFVNSLGSKQYDWVFGFEESSIAIAKKEGRYTLINEEGNSICNESFDYIEKMDDFYKVRNDTKYGLLNKVGDTILQVKYDGISRFGKTYTMWEGNQYGLVSAEGILLCDTLYKEIVVNEYLKQYAGCINDKKWGVYTWDGEELYIYDVGDIIQICENAVICEQEEYVALYDGKGNVLLDECSDINSFGYGETYEPGIFTYKKNGKASLYFQKENKFLGREYDSIRQIRDEYFYIGIDDKYGLMDKKGTVLLDVKYEYIDISSNGYISVRENGKAGFLNEKQEVIIPLQYDQASFFSDGLAAVQVDGKWGLINEEGQYVVIPTYDYITWHSDENGYREVTLDEKKGMIDYNGNIVLWPEYDYISGFHGDSDTTYVKKNELYGVVNRNYQMVLPTEYADAWCDNGLIRVEETDGDEIYFDNNGNEIIAIDGWKSLVSEDGLISAEFTDGCCIYEDDGDAVKVLEYLAISRFQEGLAYVCNDEYEKGYINEEGEEIIRCQYDEVNRFSEGLASVSKNGRWGLINEQGKTIAPLIYDYVGTFREGRVPVCRNEKWGFIDASGVEVIPLQYDNAYFTGIMGTLGVDLIGENGEKECYILNYNGEVIND